MNEHGGFTCPTWLGKNLSTKALDALCLDNTDWESLPPLGELYQVRENGEEYFGCIRGPNFRNLKKLELIGLPRFRRWVANEFCPWYLSVIEVLIVKECPRLIELPFSSYTTSYPPERDLNVTWFPRLREIEIKNCPQLLSLPPIPFSHILSSARLEHVGRGLERLVYSNESYSLDIEGNTDMPSLETVLAFDNLTKLGRLCINSCPPLAEKHLRILTSLKILQIVGSRIMFLPLIKSDVKWQLSITCLEIESWTASGKELTCLLSLLPELSRLNICVCNNITRLDVETDQQRTAVSLSMPASSVFKLQDTHGTEQQQGAPEVEEEVVAEEVVAEQQQEEDNGLLLLPSHLSNFLQDLCNRGAGGGGLQLMHSLKSTEIINCPKFHSAYKASGLSSFCPFPSSLQHLELSFPMEGMDTLVPLPNLTSLQNLTVRNMGEDLRCEGLLPLLTQGQLTKLEVSNSPKFFAGSGWDPAQSSKLQELQTDDIAGVLTLPICHLIFPSLTILLLYSNNEVEHFTKKQEEALSLLTSLQDLQFWWWDKLWCLPSGLHKLTSLKTLWIYNCPVIRSLPKNGLPSSLQELHVDDCIKLRCLPAELHKLTNLKRLKIEFCPAIRSLPKNGLPSSLQELDVSRCRNEKLKQRCRRLVGTIPLIKL
jgi:Leucine-rich repeat (LRR) protein